MAKKKRARKPRKRPSTGECFRAARDLSSAHSRLYCAQRAWEAEDEPMVEKMLRHTAQRLGDVVKRDKLAGAKALQQRAARMHRSVRVPKAGKHPSWNKTKTQFSKLVGDIMDLERKVGKACKA